MPEPRRSPSRQALAIGAAVVVVIIIVIVVVIATSGGDDDTGTTSGTGPTAIMSPATVTGITGVSAVPGAGDEPVGGTTGAADPGAVVRTLVAPGAYDCTTPGGWQPFAEIQIVVAVGEPAAGATCGDTVLDLPVGFCSTAPCSEVPADWRVEQQDGVSPQALMLLVAPVDATTGQFLCYEDSAAQRKQILPLVTTIDSACAAATSDSVEIPYVPPATSDIPYTPPPVSVDLPAG